MPSARELLEQADALMRRNRAPALAEDVPVLVDAVVPPPANPPSQAQPGATPEDSLEDVPILTDAVEEIEAPTVAEIPEEGEPSLWLEESVEVRPVAPEQPAEEIRLAAQRLAEDAKLAAERLAEAVDLANAEAASASEQDNVGFAQAEASTAESYAAEMVVEPSGTDVESLEAADDAAPLQREWTASGEDVARAHPGEHAGFDAQELAADADSEIAIATLEEAAPGEEIPATLARAEDDESEVLMMALEEGVPVEAEGPEGTSMHIDAPRDEFAQDEPLPVETEQELASEAPPSVLFAEADPQDPAPAHDPVAEKARLDALAEEIGMQVLQRVDLFTDTGLRDQLAERLQPIVDRASADLVANISQQVGVLLRAYVAEAIEREIDKLRASNAR